MQSRVLLRGPRRGARGVAPTLLACLALLLSGRAATAAELRAKVSSSMSIDCNEVQCDCLDANFQPAACPASDTFVADSGPTPDPVARNYGAEIESYFQALDGRTSAYVRTEGSADYGTLRAVAVAHTDAGGSYVVNGGDVIPSEVQGSAFAAQRDTLTVSSASAGALVTIAFTQAIAGRGEAGVGAGSAVVPCDAGAAANARLWTLLSAQASSGAAGVHEYERIADHCDPLVERGDPAGGVQLTVPDGDSIVLVQQMEAEVFARMDGGPFSPTRVIDADAYVDGSDAAVLQVRVLTPGASYTSESGTRYDAPEPGSLASGAATLLALAAARSTRRRT